MRTTCVALALLCMVGCGEKEDQLGPYVERLQGTAHYWETLLAYKGYLKSPDTEARAQDIKPFIEAFMAEMEAFPAYDDKYITAGHNAVKRELTRTLTKLVEPDFPTFTVSALKQISVIENAMIVLINSMERRWKESGKVDPYPIEWPGGE